VFDLTSNPTHRTARNASIGSSVATILAHLAGLTVLIAIPVSRVVTVQPELPSIQAFVVTPDRLPPPASPPRPPAPAPPKKNQPASFSKQPAAPIEAPIEIKSEPATPPLLETSDGVEGGIEGGVTGGVVGGVVGGIVAPVAPAPERAPVRAAAPLRISGALKPPDLLRRVDPVYAPIAVASHISGVVILEAVVDADGSIESVKTVRSSNSLLDKAATDALKQWQYAPLVLAGVPTPFVVMATFNFRFPAVAVSTATYH
jgi:protein TonB